MLPSGGRLCWGALDDGNENGRKDKDMPVREKERPAVLKWSRIKLSCGIVGRS